MNVAIFDNDITFSGMTPRIIKSFVMDHDVKHNVSIYVARLNSLSVYESDLKEKGIDKIILSGSKQSVYDNEPWVQNQIYHVRNAIENNIDVLGICFGHQLLSYAFGGKVSNGASELGWEDIRVEGSQNALFTGVADNFKQFEWHGDYVKQANSDLEVIASNKNCIQAVQVRRTNSYGVQFHPEICTDFANYALQVAKNKPGLEHLQVKPILDTYDITKDYGMKIIRNFLEQ